MSKLEISGKKPNSVTELLYTDMVVSCLFRLTNCK